MFFRLFLAVIAAVIVLWGGEEHVSNGLYPTEMSIRLI